MSHGAEIWQNRPQIYLTLSERIQTIIYSDNPQKKMRQDARRHLSFKELNKISNAVFDSKYSSSKNYYYSKEIISILEEESSPAFIKFQAQTDLESRTEAFNRYYLLEEYPKKIKQLTNYYRYHNEVPRLFMKKISPLIHNYYDLQRGIKYRQLKGIAAGNSSRCKKMTNLDCEGMDGNPLLTEQYDTKILPDNFWAQRAYGTHSSRMSSPLQTSQTINDINKNLDELFQDSNSSLSSLRFDSGSQDCNSYRSGGMITSWRLQESESGDLPPSNQKGVALSQKFQSKNLKKGDKLMSPKCKKFKPKNIKSGKSKSKGKSKSRNIAKKSSGKLSSKTSQIHKLMKNLLKNQASVSKNPKPSKYPKGNSLVAPSSKSKKTLKKGISSKRRKKNYDSNNTQQHHHHQQPQQQLNQYQPFQLNASQEPQLQNQYKQFSSSSQKSQKLKSSKNIKLTSASTKLNKKPLLLGQKIARTFVSLADPAYPKSNNSRVTQDFSQIGQISESVNFKKKKIAQKVHYLNKNNLKINNLNININFNEARSTSPKITKLNAKISQKSPEKKKKMMKNLLKGKLSTSSKRDSQLLKNILSGNGGSFPIKLTKSKVFTLFEKRSSDQISGSIQRQKGHRSIFKKKNSDFDTKSGNKHLYSRKLSNKSRSFKKKASKGSCKGSIHDSMTFQEQMVKQSSKKRELGALEERRLSKNRHSLGVKKHNKTMNQKLYEMFNNKKSVPSPNFWINSSQMSLKKPKTMKNSPKHNILSGSQVLNAYPEIRDSKILVKKLLLNSSENQSAKKYVKEQSNYSLGKKQYSSTSKSQNLFGRRRQSIHQTAIPATKNTIFTTDSRTMASKDLRRSQTKKTSYRPTKHHHRGWTLHEQELASFNPSHKNSVKRSRSNKRSAKGASKGNSTTQKGGNRKFSEIGKVSESVEVTNFSQFIYSKKRPSRKIENFMSLHSPGSVWR